MKIETLVPVAIIIVVLWRLLTWVRNLKPTSEPWGDEVDASVHQPNAVPICHRCLTPQERRHAHWFCPECGAAVGEYNNYLPYVMIFSEGEVLRAGTSRSLHPNFLIVIGYFLYTFSSFAFFAPIYWFFLIKNLIRIPSNRNSETDPDATDKV